MYLISRIDSFRGISDLEIHPTFQSGFLLENRYADILCYTGIHSRFVNNNRTFLQIFSYRMACPFHRRKIRRLVLINRRRNSDDNEFCILQFCRISSKLNGSIFQSLIPYFLRKINPFLVKFQFFFIRIKTDYLCFFSESNSQWHSYIS